MSPLPISHLDSNKQLQAKKKKKKESPQIINLYTEGLHALRVKVGPR